jgi:DNA-binding LytR/AlgR family response regulator
MISEGTKEYQKRIIIRYGDTIKAVEINDAAYFYTNNKIDYLRTFSGLEYAIDFHLDELERMLDPKQFFRINRQFIINYVAIVKMISYSKSRVKLILKPEIDQETIVSTERSPLFKVWLTGK